MEDLAVEVLQDLVVEVMIGLEAFPAEIEIPEEILQELQEYGQSQGQ